MIKQKVNGEILATDFEGILLPDEGKTSSQFDQKMLNVLQQPFLNSPLLGISDK